MRTKWRSRTETQLQVLKIVTENFKNRLFNTCNHYSHPAYRLSVRHNIFREFVKVTSKATLNRSISEIDIIKQSLIGLINVDLDYWISSITLQNIKQHLQLYGSYISILFKQLFKFIYFQIVFLINKVFVSSIDMTKYKYVNIFSVHRNIL